MLETTNILINKLTLKIVRGSNADVELDVGSIILEVLYKQITESFEAMLDWRAFTRGGSYATADNSVRGIAATAQTMDGQTLWAANLYVKDKQFARRRWKYYLAIRQLSDGEAVLYYAKCCYDHMAGSIRSVKPIMHTRDTLPDALFYDPDIQCMVGEQTYPTLPVELSDDSFQSFVDLLNDKQRSIPMMLITCADVVTPETMTDMTLGNLIVYWCADSRHVMRLNKSLQRDMYTPWDSVHIFLPIAEENPYHPCYTYDEIRRMGIDSFFAGIRQAYCANMHSDERRTFLTVEEVNALRSREYIRRLEDQCADQAERLADAEKQLTQSTIALQSARQTIDEYAARQPEAELREYENALADSMGEADALKRGITALSTRLYSTMGRGFKPDAEEPVALLQELSHAIYAALSCAAERK